MQEKSLFYVSTYVACMVHGFQPNHSSIAFVSSRRHKRERVWVRETFFPINSGLSLTLLTNYILTVCSFFNQTKQHTPTSKLKIQTTSKNPSTPSVPFYYPALVIRCCLKCGFPCIVRGSSSSSSSTTSSSRVATGYISTNKPPCR